MVGEIILEPQPNVGPCTHLRGSLVVNARRLLEDFGLRDAYDAHYAEHPGVLAELSVSAWLPLDVGHVHYAAMSELIPDVEAQVAAGERSAAKLQGSYIKTLLRAMRVAGAVAPDRALTQSHKVIKRVLKGANARITRQGPKDARMECFGIPFCRHSYFRNSWQGWWEKSLSLTAHRVFVRVQSYDDHEVVYLASWV